MMFIVLDSTPLGLITQRTAARDAEAARSWLAAKTAMGIRAVVPEIVDYELRRELIRAGKSASIRILDQFLTLPTVQFVPLNTVALKHAASLWAMARNKGTPAAHPHALDVDVILAAQALTCGLPPGEFIIATSNVRHLSLFAPAEEWSNI